MKEDNQNEKHLQANRREFLLGKGAAKGAQKALKSLVEPGLDLSRTTLIPSNQLDLAARHSAYWEQYSSRAMGCEFELLFHLQQHSHSASLATEVFQLIENLEDQMTVYRLHSEVSRINATAGLRAIDVEPQLFDLIETAVELSRETEGAFDITSAVLTQLWKFDKRAGALPDQLEIDKVLQSVGSNQIELDPEKQTIRFTNPNLQINLGGIGKGYAVDRAATLTLEKGIHDFAIHGGQSSVKAFGSDHFETRSADSTPTTEQGWWIGLSHPVRPAVRLGQFRLNNQSLGTSGTGRQGFFHHGIRYGHIIDPRTGWPTSHFLSTTVITDSAARSDALATAFFVMPFKQVVAFCESHPDVKAILVSYPERSQEQVRQPQKSELLVQTFNIADQDLQFLQD